MPRPWIADCRKHVEGPKSAITSECSNGGTIGPCADRMDVVSYPHGTVNPEPGRVSIPLSEIFACDDSPDVMSGSRKSYLGKVDYWFYSGPLSISCGAHFNNHRSGSYAMQHWQSMGRSWIPEGHFGLCWFTGGQGGLCWNDEEWAYWDEVSGNIGHLTARKLLQNEYMSQIGLSWSAGRAGVKRFFDTAFRVSSRSHQGEGGGGGGCWLCAFARCQCGPNNRWGPCLQCLCSYVIVLLFCTVRRKLTRPLISFSGTPLPPHSPPHFLPSLLHADTRLMRRRLQMGSDLGRTVGERT